MRNQLIVVLEQCFFQLSVVLLARLFDKCEVVGELLDVRIVGECGRACLDFVDCFFKEFNLFIKGLRQFGECQRIKQLTLRLLLVLLLLVPKQKLLQLQQFLLLSRQYRFRIFQVKRTVLQLNRISSG